MASKFSVATFIMVKNIVISDRSIRKHLPLAELDDKYPAELKE